MPLAALLDAREKKWRARLALAHQCNAIILTLSMNIPGPEKNLPGVAEGFAGLRHSLLAILDDPRPLRGTPWEAHTLPLVYDKEEAGADGPVWYAAVRCPALAVKRLGVWLEETHPLGRLADVDVLDADGQPVGRAELGLPPRQCFLCHNPAVLCRRSGRHSAATVMEYVHSRLAPYAGAAAAR